MSSSLAKLALLLTVAAATWCSFFLVAHARPAHTAGRGCMRRERDALLALKRGINDTEDLLKSWHRGRQDCCQWAGITCNNTTGHVIQLDLGNSNLDGQISRSLLSLEHLEYLSLSSTSLCGPRSRFPEFLGSFKNMRHLDLSNTFCSGIVSPKLGNLSKLEYLDLSNSGMYSADISWLARLPLLKYLDMSNMDLSSIAPDWPLVVNMLPSLEHLSLSHCSLSSANGSLTHRNHTNLHYLSLSNNDFNQPIASGWFWNVTGIKYLNLDETTLYGPFPNALGNMTSLISLQFSHHSELGPAIGRATTMAVDMKNLCDLENLSLDQSLSTGNITEFIDNLPQCPSNKLQYLRMHSNNMVGSMPNIMGHLTSLNSLDLSHNNISGAIPHGIGNFTYLEHLGLCNNLLSGHVPSAIGMLSNLIELDLSKNNLDGEITNEHLVNLKNLEHMDLSNNYFSGPLPLEFRTQGLVDLIMSFNYFSGHIPESICLLKNLLVLDLSNNFLEGRLPQCSQGQSLVFLFLSNNNLSGEFPTTLQNYSSLAFIDLSRNNFCGTLPLWIGDFKHLIFLQLSYNLLYGEIPGTITNLKGLRQLILAGNSLSGALPQYLSNLTGMSSQNQDQNIGMPDVSKLYTGREGQFTEVQDVVMKGQNLKYGGARIFYAVNIDLSLNQLVGGIPDSVTSLNGLLNLNLSRNHLSGKIPANIGAMESMESLDLSMNNLSGEIPSSMTDLTSLSSLDLSYNNLNGRIPHGSQLDTLYTENPSIYTGNIGLCGPPLGRNCSGESTPEHGNQQKSEKVHEPVLFLYFGLASGFVAGLWVVFCSFLFKKAWRIAYFRHIDMMYDNAYVSVVITWGRMYGKETS